MRYFWNSESQRARKKIPIQVLYFFEIDREHPGTERIVTPQVTNAAASLISKSYVRLLQDTAEIELDTDGMAWVKDQHPSALRWWQKFLESTPPTLQIITAVVGFVASIYGVIEFCLWLVGKGEGPVM